MSSSSKKRCRASVACKHCRARRIKCIVREGQTRCDHCLNLNSECIITDTDERKRPSSKAHVRALTDRIRELEKQVATLTAEDIPNPPQHQPEPIDPEDEASSAQASPNIISRRRSSPINLSQQCPSCATKQQAAAEHCFPAASIRHASDAAVTDAADPRESIDTYIQRISPPIREYLLQCYYQSYNIIVQMIHPEAFAIDRARGGVGFYSPLLYICMLMIGYRYAIRLRPNIGGLDLLHLDSKLHQKLKAEINRDVSSQWTVSLMQALLLVADLEAATHRYAEGWIHCGIASQICVALAREGLGSGHWRSRQAMDAMKLAIRACVTYNRCWSFTIGYPAPTYHLDIGIFMIHNDDVVYLPTPDTGREAGCDTYFEVSNAFESLMALASTISDAQLRSKSAASASISYLNDVAMDRQLSEWYEQLPAALKWSRANTRNANSSFLFLHQQYHYVAITLHLACATFGNTQIGSTDDVGDSAKAALELSRNICYDHAMRLIQALELRSRVSVSPMMITSTLHHIQTAASAIVNHLRLYNDHTAASKPLQTLLRLAQLEDETNPLARNAVKYINDALNDSSHGINPASHKSSSSLRPSKATSPLAPHMIWREQDQLLF